MAHARKFRPSVEIDPSFGKLFEEAENAGVEVKAVTTRFGPPNLYLAREVLVEIRGCAF